MLSEQHARKTRSQGMPGTARGASPLARLVAVVVLAAVMALSPGSGAHAQSVHNAFGSYSVVFGAENTAFNSMHLTNGYSNEICCFGRYQTTDAPDDHLSVQFIADPGYAFTYMSMGFTQYYYQTNAYQGYTADSGDWSVSNGTFARGTDSGRYGNPTYDPMGWDQTGTSGTFFRRFYFWNSGGVASFIPIMSSDGISFADAPEFTLDMNLSGSANGNFGTYLDVYAETEVAPVSTTPEPASFVLMATGLLGLIGVARRRRPASDVACLTV
ncbi:hypothetical protein BH09GEM1_BH09GEM1_09670 [soil metagenome]